MTTFLVLISAGTNKSESACFPSLGNTLFRNMFIYEIKTMLEGVPNKDGKSELKIIR